MSKTNYSIAVLMEGDYHYGLGALVNSLYRADYRGCVWTGYRGALPPWAQPLRSLDDAQEFVVADGCVVRFVSLNTSAHLTNCKPEWMLRVLERLDPACVGVLYLDPDILAAAPWTRFEEWLSCGVAVCADVNSPVPLYHPRRIGWRRTFLEAGICLAPRDETYANAGVVGVPREHREFLLVWERLQQAVWEVIGSAEYAGIPGGKSVGDRSGFFGCFGQPDQDALNAAMELAHHIPVSFLGRQAMGFEAGSAMVPHALGRMKPWRNSILGNAFSGWGCPITDKLFWNNVEEPIRLYPSGLVKQRKAEIALASAIARFMRRN